MSSFFCTTLEISILKTSCGEREGKEENGSLSRLWTHHSHSCVIRPDHCRGKEPEATWYCSLSQDISPHLELAVLVCTC